MCFQRESPCGFHVSSWSYPLIFEMSIILIKQGTISRGMSPSPTSLGMCPSFPLTGFQTGKHELCTLINLKFSLLTKKLKHTQWIMTPPCWPHGDGSPHMQGLEGISCLHVPSRFKQVPVLSSRHLKLHLERAMDTDESNGHC